MGLFKFRQVEPRDKDPEILAESIAGIFFEALKNKDLLSLVKMAKAPKVQEALSNLDERESRIVDQEIFALILFYIAYGTKHFFIVSDEIILRAYEIVIEHLIETEVVKKDLNKVGKLFTDRYNKYEELIGEAKSPKDDDKVAEFFLHHVLLVDNPDLDTRYYVFPAFSNARFKIGFMVKKALR